MGLNNEVIVVGHEAVSKGCCRKPIKCMHCNIEKYLPIDIILRDWLTAITACRDVTERTFELEPQGTGHICNCHCI